MGGTAKLYRDVTPTERTHISPEGKVMKVYRVSAYTRGNVYFSLDVDEKDFSKEHVDKMLTEKATLIDSVQDL